MGIEGKSHGSEKDPVRKRMKICWVCGDRGFSELLVYCSECFDRDVHRYCLGLVPGSEEDTNVYWVCESCCPLMESEPCETALVENQPEVLKKLPPKSLPEILEEERSQFQHSGETFAPMTVSYNKVFLSPIIEHPETTSQGLCSSGEITIHESHKPDFSHIGELVYKDDENEERHSIEDTIELDFGADEQIDSAFLSETVELDFGADEENDVCYPDKPPTMLDFVVEDQVHQGIKAPKVNDRLKQIDSRFLSETVELDFGTDEENDVCYPDKPPTMLDFVVEDQVHQGIKAPKINVGIQRVSTNFQPELLSLPVPNHTVQPTLSENESQCSKPHDSPEMSIPASVLYMANKLRETTLNRIDVNVGQYKIRSDLAPILRNILSKYGDIFHDCTVQPDLVTICQAIQHLHQIPFKNLRQQHIDDIRDTLKLADACAVNVEWLRKHCDYIQEVVHQTVKYPALKKEWEETVRNVHLKKKMVDSSGSKQEGHLRKLEDNMKSIKSLWRRISSKSLDDGLF